MLGELRWELWEPNRRLSTYVGDNSIRGWREEEENPLSLNRYTTNCLLVTESHVTGSDTGKEGKKRKREKKNGVAMVG